MISLPQQRVLCRNPHHPAGCMRSEPCLFSNPPELPKRSRPQSEAGDACDGPVLFRRSPRRSRRDDSVLNADFSRYSRFVARYFSGYSYFPLAGRGSRPADVNGCYWSTGVTSGDAYYLSVTPTGASWTSNTKTIQSSVRCVRTACARTGRPSFAVRGAFAFPLAGSGGSPADVEGRYWSSTAPTATSSAYSLAVTPIGSSVPTSPKKSEYSVRCVRTACARTGRPSFAVRGAFAFPLAGSGGSPADVEGRYWSSTAPTATSSAYSLAVTPIGSSVPTSPKKSEYSVRCVRTACARTGRPSFAVRGAFAFPLAGSGGSPADVEGRYWSSTAPTATSSAYSLAVTPIGSSVPTSPKKSEYSVRCVRTACARTGRPSFAVRGAFAFPLAGWGGGSADVEGCYWSSTPVTGGGNAYTLSVMPTSSSVASKGKTNQYSVRCVRTACARTGRPSFAVRGAFAFPLAGSGSAPAEVGGYYWSRTTGSWTYFLAVTPTGSSVPGNGVKTDQYSVRCVRTVFARTGRPSFAVRGAFAFPLAGSGSAPAEVGGYYWSTTTGSWTYFLAVTPTASSVSYVTKPTAQYSVRCVRTVFARTGRPYDGICEFRMKIEMRLQRASCRNPHHPARCMRSEPCLFSNPPEFRKRPRPFADEGAASGFSASVMFRRLSRRSRRDDSVRGHAPRMVFAVLSSDFPVVAWGFPLAGNGSSPANVNGYYWSSTANNTNNAYNLNVTPTSSSVPNNNKTNQYSVRCVRTVCARTGRPSF